MADPARDLDYVIKKWEKIIGKLPPETAALVAQLLENQARFGKTPLQYLADELAADEESEEEGHEQRANES